MYIRCPYVEVPFANTEEIAFVPEVQTMYRITSFEHIKGDIFKVEMPVREEAKLRRDNRYRITDE